MQPFICVYIAIIATILQVTMWLVDSVPPLKKQWLRVEILAGRALKHRQHTLEGGLVCESTG